jgi:Mrp family chromosome partitioning ATPase
MSLTLDALKKIENRQRHDDAVPGRSAETASWNAQASDVSIRSTDHVLESEYPIASSALLDEPAVAPGLPTGQHEVPWPCQRESTVDYESLAKNLLGQWVVDRPAALMFTSPGDGDGKTELLTALAPTLAARAERPVLVVDADFTKGDLTRRLDASTGGLAALFTGEFPLNDVACLTAVPRLDFLPQGDQPAFVRGLTDPSIVEAVLNDLKAGYPLVLLDAPSLIYPNVATLGSFCDGICLVVRPGHTLRRAVRDAARVIDTTGGRLLGCIAIGG